jgi:hypothetical protein
MNDNDNILAKDLICISRVSLLLTGNEFTLRWDRGFGKYKVSVERLLVEVQNWIDSDKIVLSPIGLNTADVVYDYGKITTKEVHAMVDKLHNNQNKECYDVLPTEEFYTDPRVQLDYKQFGVSVTSLPKERKMIIDGNLKGLYSAGNKWYTNKIVDNGLVILEWNKLDYAKKYLESLIK